jgi:hypothetical protein
MPYPNKVSNISVSLQVLQVIFHSRHITPSGNNFRIDVVGCPRLQSACFPLAESVVQLARFGCLLSKQTEKRAASVSLRSVSRKMGLRDRRVTLTGKKSKMRIWVT